MSYQGSHSPPSFHFDYIPSQTSPVGQHLPSEQHTPKRRRLETGVLQDFAFDASPPMSSNDLYDLSFSPPQDFVPNLGSSQGSNMSVDFPVIQPPFSANWNLEPRWDEPPPRTHAENDEFEQSLRDAVLMNDVNNARACPQPIAGHSRALPYQLYRYPEDFAWIPPVPPRTNFNIAPQSASPPRQRIQPLPPKEKGQQQYHQGQAPMRGPRIPVRLPTAANIVPPTPQHHPPPPRHKSSITLTLSRATDARIDALAEHKRECPACQLEFEPDNYLAVISCCGTAMHATCLSAWVNSQTYTKTKVCMKCRKSIDARRPLNNVVPPVTDKSWDEGVDFNAPESVQGDTKIELDVGGRTSSIYHRYGHGRRPSGYHRRRAPLIMEDDLPVEVRPSFHKMQKEYREMTESLKARHTIAYNEWQTAFEAEIQAAQTAANAKEVLHTRTGVTQHEIAGLVERCREAREVQEIRHAAFRRLVREQDELEKSHQRRISALMEEAMLIRRRNASAAEAQAQAQVMPQPVNAI